MFKFFERIKAIRDVDAIITTVDKTVTDKWLNQLEEVNQTLEERKEIISSIKKLRDVEAERHKTNVQFEKKMSRSGGMVKGGLITAGTILVGKGIWRLVDNFRNRK